MELIDLFHNSFSKIICMPLRDSVAMLLPKQSPNEAIIDDCEKKTALCLTATNIVLCTTSDEMYYERRCLIKNPVKYET